MKELANKNTIRLALPAASSLESVLSKDHAVIAQMVPNGARVLDLGCAKGELLNYLRQEKNAVVYGVEQDALCLPVVLKKNIPIYHGDILEGLSMFPNNSLDVAILSRTVQELIDPHIILHAMLKKARRVVVSFLNYGYYKNRIYTLLHGSKPISNISPKSWPFHAEMKPLSISDFEAYARSEKFVVVQRYFLNGNWSKPVRFFPNLTCGVAVFMLQRQEAVNKKNANKANKKTS